MEVKKTPKADLQNKKGLFLEIGLTVALGLMILMFSWSQSERVIDKLDNGNLKVAEEITDITVQDQKPPEIAQAKTIAVVSDILNVVRNDSKVATDFDFGSEFDENAAVAPPKAKAAQREEKAEEEEIFLTAEVMPTFQGGDLNTFRNWVQSKLKYPTMAFENQVQGRVVLSFVVGKDGKVSRVQVLQTPDKSLGEEAARVIADSPEWKPAKQRGNTVPIRYNIPIDFKIQLQ